jgi:septum formation protein
MERLMIPFEVVPPAIDETPKNGEAPAALVERLSVEKARAVANSHPHSLVIGSDQIAVHQGQIVGKPRDHAHAAAQLRAASGESITLLTGLALIDSDSGRVQVDVVPYTVKFRTLSEAQMHSYLQKERPYQCIGLPLIRLIDMLHTEGLEIL